MDVPRVEFDAGAFPETATVYEIADFAGSLLPCYAIGQIVQEAEAEAYSKELGQTVKGRSAISPFFAATLGRASYATLVERAMGSASAPTILLSQDVQIFAPVRVGDVVTCVTFMRSFRPMGKGARSLLQQEITVERCVAIRVLTGVQFLVRNSIPEFGEEDVRSSVPRPRELQVVGEFSAPRDNGRRWATVSGDYQPIHLDDDAARSVGFNRAVVHGTYSLARTAQVIVERFCAGDEQLLKHFSVRFAKPVYPEDRVLVAAYELNGTDRGNSERRLAFRCSTNGRAVLRDGWVTLRSAELGV